MDAQKAMVLIACLFLGGMLLGGMVTGQATFIQDFTSTVPSISSQLNKFTTSTMLPITIISSCTDNDADGFYAQPDCSSLIDCDDSNPRIYPGAEEICGNIDYDCDGLSLLCQANIEVVALKSQYKPGEKVTLL